MNPENCYFRLISQTLTFRAVRIWNNHGIVCITGISLDGRRQTTARILDVSFIHQTEAAN